MAACMVSTIAIAGISSKLALRVVEELLKEPKLTIRGSCRKKAKLPPWLRDHSERISLIQTDPYDREALKKLVAGCDVVVCCYLADNDTMWSIQKLLIDLCEAEKVRRYIASDYTADYTQLNYGDVMIKDPMKRVKAYLDDNSAIKGVHILVGLLTETFLELFGFWNEGEQTLSYWGSGQEQWELTSYRTAAQYVAALALDEDAGGLLHCMCNYMIRNPSSHVVSSTTTVFISPRLTIAQSQS